MITDTEGIVLRQTRTVNGRQMLVIFSRKFGKISVGANQTGGMKNKSALATRPFTYASYELFKSRENYNLNRGYAKQCYFDIGKDFDKFMTASYALELTNSILPEEQPQPKLFLYLLDFLSTLEKRTKKHETLLLAYMVKALDEIGNMPETGACVFCGRKLEKSRQFSISGGGTVCEKCLPEVIKSGEESLLYDVNFDIINILDYFREQPFSKFEKIALDDEVSSRLLDILRKYFAYHLEISELKSESIKI